MRLVSCLSTLALGLALATSGHAGAPPEKPAEPPTGAAASVADAPRESDQRCCEPASSPEYDDYRLTMMATDAAAISLIVGTAVFVESESIAVPLFAAGVGTYALDGPAIHLAHRQPLRSLQSFALRVGLPSIGVVLGVGMAASCDEGEGQGWCVVAAAGFGGLVALGGVLTALIIDNGMLGKVRKEPGGARGRGSPGVGLGPLFVPDHKGPVGVAFVGAF